jgi:DNA-directed RNA polymerase alpha subunit
MPGERIAFTCPHCGKETVYAPLGVAQAEPAPEERLKAMDIIELGLSVRAGNALYHADIKTVGDLIRLTPIELLRIDNLGRVTFKEICGCLKTVGLSLAPEWRSIPPRFTDILAAADSREQPPDARP